MRTIQWMIGILIFILFSSPASADFYRYVDKHGNILFTDDLSKVPPEQRGKVQSYEAIEPLPQPDAKKDEVKKEIKEETEDKAATEAETHRRKLINQQSSLNKEYDNLMEERTELDKEKGKAVTQTQIKEYNKKVIEFNTRIKSYEEKRDALTREVKSFNESVEARQQQKPEEKQ